jgi:hypothetical protein
MLLVKWVKVLCLIVFFHYIRGLLTIACIKRSPASWWDFFLLSQNRWLPFGQQNDKMDNKGR